MTDFAHEQAFQIGMGETSARFGNALDRLLHLRSLPNIGSLRGGGLTYIAERSVERIFRAGEAIYDERQPVDSVHFIVEGNVRVMQDGIHLLDVAPPFAIGFMPVLSAHPVNQSAVALEDTVTLELPGEELHEVFEDDFAFLEGGVRRVARQILDLQSELESKQQLERTTPEPVPYPADALDFIQRIQAMSGGVLASSNLEPVVQLARRAEELRMNPGDVLWEVGEAPAFGVNVVYGVVRCESPTRTFRMGPASSVGFLESYARRDRSYRAVAETKVVALRGRVDDFFDILEDHTDLAMAILSSIAEALLALQLQAAKARVAPTDPEEE